jgi:DNA-binding NarL/FixJ family response regulator
LTGDSAPDPLVIAIAVDDLALAERLAGALGDVAGVRLAINGEASDVTVIASSASGEPGADLGSDSPLTPREQAVLRLLAEGASNKEIARALGISAHTAKFHVSQLLEKLDASGRTDAVANAVRMGVIAL